MARCRFFFVSGLIHIALHLSAFFHFHQPPTHKTQSAVGVVFCAPVQHSNSPSLAYSTKHAFQQTAHCRLSTCHHPTRSWYSFLGLVPLCLLTPYIIISIFPPSLYYSHPSPFLHLIPKCLASNQHTQHVATMSRNGSTLSSRCCPDGRRTAT